MKKIEVERREGEYPEIVLKQDENVSLNINFARNLDLYFVLDGADIQDYFEITKEDFGIYEKFLKLYNNIMEGRVFSGDDSWEEYLKNYKENPMSYEEFLERNKKHRELLKNGDNYNLLVKNGVITWYSDDYPTFIAPSFQIIKEEDKFVIRFDRGIEKEQDLLPSKFWISIRIRTSGSNYHPFHVNFMELFKDLKEMNLEDEQIYIEEFEYVKRVLKK